MKEYPRDEELKARDERIAELEKEVLARRILMQDMDKVIGSLNFQVQLLEEALDKIRSTGCKLVYPCNGELKCVGCISIQALQKLKVMRSKNG